MIRRAERIVVLTGAGISTAAGIPDFRGPQGLYVTRSYDPERVFDIAAFRREPAPFFEFTRDLMSVLDTIEPTFTHLFLAELEAEGKVRALITQNIDPLHQQAGSRVVIPIHGGYWTSHCLDCDQSFKLGDLQEMLGEMAVPLCECGGLVKPDVVFFGEAVDGIDAAVEAVHEADLMLVLGSSLMVYPAAFLPQHARSDVIVVNMGSVGLHPAPGRYFVDSDLDAYFREVKKSL